MRLRGHEPYRLCRVFRDCNSTLVLCLLSLDAKTEERYRVEMCSIQILDRIGLALAVPDNEVSS